MKIPAIIKNNFALFFFAICWLLLSVQTIAFFLIASINDFPLIGTIALGCIDALLVLSPYLVLPRKWRWTIIFPMIIIPIFYYANTLYLRWFPDLMAFSIIANGASNATGTVAEGALSCIKGVDAWIIAPFFIFIFVYSCFVSKISAKPFSCLFKYWVIIAVCMLFFVEQLSLINAFCSNKSGSAFTTQDSQDSGSSTENYYQHLLTGTRRQQFQYFGIVPYVSLQIFEALKPKYVNLTPDELASIDNYLKENASKPLLIDSLPDNSDKNLILIVVESLNSDALNLTANGRPIMPFLSSFLEKENDVIRMDSVLSQVGIGRSSDGRFIYQTGILPITDDPVALKYIDYTYPSLSSALSREGVEFDCGDPIQWNKIDLSKKYGFHELHTRDELIKGMKKYGGKDPALFNNALPIIEKLQQPFYVALNTMDMHDPYEEYGWKHSDVWQDNTLSDSEKIYIEKCRQFDAGLSQFIAGLKKNGLYDKSVIVVTGDHNARPNCLNGKCLVHTQIPIIILNSGLDIRSHAVIGQSDLYPTILDIMGATDAKWRGVGTSILRNPAVIGDLNSSNSLNMPEKAHSDPYTYPSTEAWRVSDLIIRSAHQRQLIND
ncbi:MAG: LTA synthase family protein [Muribaculaceae bacterium]|nr:LTA synthase family protein [Muribaculaceae bacterium]